MSLLLKPRGLPQDFGRNTQGWPVRKPENKNGSKGGNIHPEAGLTMLKSSVHGEIIDFGHFWGKFSTPIPTWKSHFRDLCDLYVEAHFFTFTICFIKTDLITNFHLSKDYMLRKKTYCFTTKKIRYKSSFNKNKKAISDHFWRIPIPPFWLGFFKINRQQHHRSINPPVPSSISSKGLTAWRRPPLTNCFF